MNNLEKLFAGRPFSLKGNILSVENYDTGALCNYVVDINKKHFCNIEVVGTSYVKFYTIFLGETVEVFLPISEINFIEPKTVTDASKG